MLSINKKKLIVGLASKKQRDQKKLFVAEGHKLVRDLLHSGIKPLLLLVDPQERSFYANGFPLVELVEVTPQEMKQVSQLNTPSPVLAVMRQPDAPAWSAKCPNDLLLVLDGIQDPGNMGTILRLADWFGIRQIICSPDCVDVFNFKVVQATMGALSRVAVMEMPLTELFELNRNEWKLPVYGTLLNGANMYTQSLGRAGLIVMGNEGKGIGEACLPYVSHPLLIPGYPPGSVTSESLNVATATAIVCAEFRRRMA